jgi:uncharacterized protein (TIGR00251 family)
VADADPSATVSWQQIGQSLRLDLKVIPNAKADKVDGLVHDADGRPRLALRLKAPPVDGKANAGVIAFLANALRCPRSALAITAGQTSRQKRITWVDRPADAEARLQALLDGKTGRPSRHTAST